MSHPSLRSLRPSPRGRSYGHPFEQMYSIAAGSRQDEGVRMERRESADVVVVGGGSAAHEAAVAAKHYGAGRVVLVEKAPQDQSGGNARYSGTGFRWAFDDIDEVREVTETSPEDWANILVHP